MKKFFIILLLFSLSINISLAKSSNMIFLIMVIKITIAAKFMDENPSSNKRISWSEDCFYFNKKNLLPQSSQIRF